MSTQLNALKALSDTLMVLGQLKITADQITAVLQAAHERGTPWNDSDWAKVDAAQKGSEDRLSAARKAAGFIT